MISFNLELDNDKAELFILLLKEITDLQQYNIMKDNDCWVRQGIHSVIDDITLQYNNKKDLKFKIGDVINTKNINNGKIIYITNNGEYIVEYKTSYYNETKQIKLTDSQLINYIS